MNHLLIVISDIADVAQVVIAIANILLIIYTFTYTRKKDNNDYLRNITLQQQNINLQWFKELIVMPNISAINDFYSTITSISQNLIIAGTSSSDKILILNEIKEEQTKLRKSFVDILKAADLNLEKAVKGNLDNLVDALAVSIFDTGIDFANAADFEREISRRIIYSKNDLLALIYNFDGL